MTRIGKDATKTDLIRKQNKNTYRYLDDILPINNDDFDLSTSDLYSNELIIKLPITIFVCPLLDLYMRLCDGNLSTNNLRQK